ncbi:MAG: hypothetical protein JO176_08120 [Acidimicrobiia bacterium]|nr:hypothetical protein [Acidimicrobiia bacterium]
MRTTELRELLGELEDSATPEPSALFVAKLEADLRTMDQAAEAEARPQRAPRRRRARLLVAAGPVAAMTAAAAAAAVTLLPSDPHPRQVTTADPGVTVPAPPRAFNETPTSVPTATTVAPPPWLPPAAAPPPPSTTANAAPHADTHAPASGPSEHATPMSVPVHEPVTTTVPPETTTTTAPAPQTLSLNCHGAMVNGSPAVSCAWTQSTSPSFAWYRLYREAQGSNRVLLFSSDARTTTSTGDTTAQAGTTYSYVIEASDAAGNVVGKSTPVIVSCC